MAAADAALEVHLVRGHVVGTDLVVDAGASASHGRNDVVTRRDLAHVRTDGLHSAEVFMADRQKVVAVRSGAVFAGIDLLIGAVDAAAQQAHQHPAAVRHLVQGRHAQVGQMHAVALAREHGDRFHVRLLCFVSVVLSDSGRLERHRAADRAGTLRDRLHGDDVHRRQHLHRPWHGSSARRGPHRPPARRKRRAC